MAQSVDQRESSVSHHGGHSEATNLPLYGHGDLLASTPQFSRSGSSDLSATRPQDGCRGDTSRSQYGSSISLTSAQTSKHHRSNRQQLQPLVLNRTCSSETKLDSLESGQECDRRVTVISGQERDRKKQRHLDHIAGKHLSNGSLVSGSRLRRTGGSMDTEQILDPTRLEYTVRGRGRQLADTPGRSRSQLVTDHDSSSTLNSSIDETALDTEAGIDEDSVTCDQSLMDDNVSCNRSLVDVEENDDITSCASTMSYVDKVVEELLDTERSYVRDLYDVINVSC